MVRIRWFELGVCAGALLMAQPTLGAPVSPFDSLAPMSDEDLGDMRGGFLTAGGVSFDFGAVVRTYVDGQLALETRLTWTPTGAVTEQITGSLPGWTPLVLGQAGGLDLSGLSPGSNGLVLTDANGTTALVHNVLNGQLQNLVVNAADNRDIRQDMQVMLTLPNFDVMQQDFSVAQLGSQIFQDVDWGGIRATGP